MYEYAVITTRVYINSGLIPKNGPIPTCVIGIAIGPRFKKRAFYVYGLLCVVVYTIAISVAPSPTRNINCS